MWIKWTPADTTEEKGFAEIKEIFERFPNRKFHMAPEWDTHSGKEGRFINREMEITNQFFEATRYFNVTDPGDFFQDAICVKKNDKYGLLGPYGLLTKIEFDRKIYCEQYKFFLAEKDKKLFVLNIKGELLTPALDYIENASYVSSQDYEQWYNTGRKYLIAAYENKYGLLDNSTMDLVIDYEFDHIVVTGNNTNLSFSLEKDGKFGLFENDKILIDPVFDKPFDYYVYKSKSNIKNGRIYFFDSDWNLIIKKSELNRIKLIELLAIASYGENQRPLNLEGIDFSNEDFSRLNLSKASFKKCIFEGTKFNSTDLSQTDFSNAEFNGTDFSGANLKNSILTSYKHCNFSNTEFESSFLNFYEINPELTNFSSAKFYKSSIILSPFSELQDSLPDRILILSNTIFESCKIESYCKNFDFRSAAFVDCRFRDVIFENCIFASGTFRNITTTKTQFRNCEFYGNQTIANLEGEFHFENCLFDTVDFYKLTNNVIFNDCTFTGTITKDSTFEDAQLINE